MNTDPKMIFITKYGVEFETREEAKEITLEDKTHQEFIEALAISMNWYKLIEWALKQDSFYDNFANEIEEAEKEFCDTTIISMPADCDEKNF